MKKNLLITLLFSGWMSAALATNCQCSGYIDGYRTYIFYESGGSCSDPDAIDYSSGWGYATKPGSPTLLFYGADPDACLL